MSDRLDVTRRGARDFTPEQEAAVLRWFFENGRKRFVPYAEIAKQTGIEGRTVRAIAVYHDGRTFLLAGGDEGVKVAEFAEEADVLTGRLDAQAGSLNERVERRRKFAIPSQQGRFF